MAGQRENGEPERREDDEARDRLTEIQTGFREVSRKLLVSTALQGIVLVLTLAAFGYLLNETTTQAKNNKATSIQIALALDQIQAERRRNTFTACVAKNKEHTATVAFLAKLQSPEDRVKPEAIRFIHEAKKSFPQTNCFVDTTKKVKP